MKFKYLIITFCVIIISVLLATILLPMIVSGQSILVNLRIISLPLMILMSLLLISLSVFFILNYKLLSLLEREDWPALAYYLEQKIFVKGRYNSRNVRILASSYLVISDYQSVLKLESKSQIAKPSVISKNVLIFGAARILNGMHDDTAVFYRLHLEKCAKKDKQWVRWFYGFSSLLSGNYNQAETEFASLAVSSGDSLISGLSAYFLASSLGKKTSNPEKCRNSSEQGKIKVIKALKNLNGWKKETDKLKNEVHTAIIKRYLEETGNWLFGNG